MKKRKGKSTKKCKNSVVLFVRIKSDERRMDRSVDQEVNPRGNEK